MIQATLDVSRFEAGRLPLRNATTDLGAFMAEVRAGIPEYWHKPEVALQWSVAANLPVVELDGAIRSKLGSVVPRAIPGILRAPSTSIFSTSATAC